VPSDQLSGQAIFDFSSASVRAAESSSSSEHLPLVHGDSQHAGVPDYYPLKKQVCI
jgi:hypothetical protein